MFCALMIYLLAFAIRLLLILRGDERSRRTADIYIVSLASASCGSSRSCTRPC
jgi:hypothetical protein